MKHSILALPALLRTALILASASQHSFSVHDDLLAFPQYEVRFSEDYIPESEAQAQLQSNDRIRDIDQQDEVSPSEVQQYGASYSQVGSDDAVKEEEKLEFESLVLDGQRYLCSIPQVKPSADQTSANETVSKVEQEKELARATDRGWELLGGMQGQCLYFVSGWWSYKFCYNDGVRQFHQLPQSRGVPAYPPVEDPGVEGYSLGLYQKGEKNDESGSGQEADAEAGSAMEVSKRKLAGGPQSGELVQRGDSRFLVQRLDGGTKCDLTGKPRRIEVQFHCNPQSTDNISLIKEVATCAYLMVIQTPRLCNDVAFLPPQKDQPNAIVCSPVLAEDEIEAYEQDLQALKQEVKAANVWEATEEAAKIFFRGMTGGGSTGVSEAGGPQKPQIVGDILVGGHAMVPKDLKLKKGTIVGGGEKFVDTVASSDGKVLSKEAIEKLGLGDPKAVEKLAKELDKISDGAGWRLDVVDTPTGREYRGIIGTGDGEEGEGEGEGEGEEEKESSEEAKKDGEGEGAGVGKDRVEGGDKQEGSEEEYYKEEL